MTQPIETVKVDLPLSVSANPKTVVQICKQQSTLIKQCPAYPTTAPVQTVVVDMDGAVTLLDGTNNEIDQLKAKLSALDKTRGTQVAAVRIKHDAVATTLTAASNNDPEAAKAWTGKTRVRTKPAQVPVTMAAPSNPALNGIKRHPGSVKASCDEEAGAVGYLFQFGGDPNHPEAWPAPLYTHGHTCTLRNQTIGQILCVRIAIVRRGSVQGAWSTILQLTVR